MTTESATATSGPGPGWQAARAAGSHRRSGPLPDHAAGCDRLRRHSRWPHLQGRGPGVERDLGKRARIHNDLELGSRARAVRRCPVPLRHSGQLVWSSSPRNTAVDRDRSLSHRACPTGHPDSDRNPGRAAGRDPERDPRALGDPGSRARDAVDDRAGAAFRTGLDSRDRRACSRASTRPLGCSRRW